MMVYLLASLCALACCASAGYLNPALSLPAFGQLPKPASSGYVNLSTVDIWYAHYGPSLESPGKKEPPILFLHGAFGSAHVFTHQITALQAQRPNTTLLAIDSRMQGRSTGLNGPISYDLMTGDVLGVLDHFKIEKAIIVGWSDGGIISLDLAMHHPHRAERIFAFGASYNPSNVNKTALTSPTFTTYLQRAKREYHRQAPDPNFAEASRKIGHMLATLPQNTHADYLKIPTLYQSCEHAPLIWIVDASDEEAVKTGTARTLHDWISGSGLLILPSVSHFAFVQDPTTFNDVVFRFLDYKVDCSG